MPLMLRNRYAKDVGGISIGQKIIHNKPQEGVVLTPSLGIGGLTLLHNKRKSKSHFSLLFYSYVYAIFTQPKSCKNKKGLKTYKRAVNENT